MGRRNAQLIKTTMANTVANRILPLKRAKCQRMYSGRFRRFRKNPLDRYSLVFDNIRIASPWRRRSKMPITARQRRVLDYIKDYFEVNQEAPTIAEIGKEFGMSSSASVHHVVSTLEREGVIRRIPNVSRGIELVQETLNEQR